MPRSRERFTIGLALSISTIHSSELPKDIVPRQMRETWSPVGPSWEYCIERRGRSTRFLMFKSSMVCPGDLQKKMGTHQTSNSLTISRLSSFRCSGLFARWSNTLDHNIRSRVRNSSFDTSPRSLSYQSEVFNSVSSH